MTGTAKPEALRWASIDAAKNVSGVATWVGVALVSTRVVRGLAVAAWADAFAGCAGYVVEDGYVGPNRSTGLALAYARGRISAIAEMAAGCECWSELSAAKWRREVGVQARSRKQAKQAARSMCRWLCSAPDSRVQAGSKWDLYHLDVLTGSESDDECEAVLIGLAYQSLADRAS